MKTNKALIKELLRELHYHQMLNRVDARCLKKGIAKCKEIAERIRELQKRELGG